MDPNTRPPEPHIKMVFPLFLAVCMVSGLMIGVGLGRGAAIHPLWFILAAFGLGLNLFGILCRIRTARLELFERIEVLTKTLNELHNIEFHKLDINKKD